MNPELEGDNSEGDGGASPVGVVIGVAGVGVE